MTQHKGNKEFQKKIKEAFLIQELKDKQSDSLESQVYDQHGECIASSSKEWRCNAKNCSFQNHRGHSLQLTSKVADEDKVKLAHKQKFACLRHYPVQGQKLS